MIAAVATGARAQQTCPAAANAIVDAGWAAYRADDMTRAQQQFDAAVRRCPTHPGALTGSGYVALRRNALDEAERAFTRALQQLPASADAWFGRGLVAWRRSDMTAARAAFERVVAIDTNHTEARAYLDRIAAAAGAGRAPAQTPSRAALVRPDTVVFPARAIGNRFEIRTAQGWRPFYVKGVNIGAALPGRYASEFPDSVTYARWLQQIGDMGANTIRIYTMHPPHFYSALRAYNLRAAQPLWLIHGVWAELPPNDVVYDDPTWEGEFFEDIHRVVDILHGRADLPVRPGHAHGHYVADVSPWTLGYIIGREWESHSVAGYNTLRPQATGWRGTYLRLAGGTPMDAWMAKATEEVVRYEMQKYNAQRPVAYTNWPTTDPLRHPMESTIMEEVAIRRALGEPISIRPTLEGEDAVTLDPSLIHATDKLPAGYFASYHVYPYFPDFMVMSPEYNRATSPWGRSNYWGYLEQLKRHHADLPLLISEYGVPTSIGVAHLHPQGWHHGGNGEAYMADVNARLTKEIAESGAAGGIVFAWIDEWFKRTWNTTPYEIPGDRNRLWRNRMDAEEHYGMVAMDPAPRLAGGTLAERLSSWSSVAPLYSTRDGARVRALADEAYLWLLFEPGGVAAQEALFGIDTVDPQAGGFAWPGRVGPRLPVGAEFVVQVTQNEARVLAAPSASPQRIIAASVGMRGAPRAEYPPIERQPPGFFRGRWTAVPNLPLLSRPDSTGEYAALRVLTSRSRWARDTTEIGAMGYDWGVLPRGPLPDGLWERDAQSGAVEVRVPWQLVNVTDPSSRRVLQDSAQRRTDQEVFGTTVIDGVRIVAAARGTASAWRAWPESGARSDVARFTWSTWETPQWQARLRPSYHVMKRVWSELDPPVVRGTSR